ncbi:hypothetical protein BHE74_00052480 [Ensete ventricosum]|nr:hypothetical protein BHE74_00052480 [Ensete ventricosum]
MGRQCGNPNLVVDRNEDRFRWAMEGGRGSDYIGKGAGAEKNMSRFNASWTKGRPRWEREHVRTRSRGHEDSGPHSMREVAVNESRRRLNAPHELDRW